MAEPNTKIITDQLGNNLSLPNSPQRIISLVPSQTELLFDLGLENRIVGITKFCIHPKEKVKSKTLIGGTKNFNFEVIAQLKPDLIIGNKEENYLDGITELQKKYTVWMSDIYSLQDAMDMIKNIGSITGKNMEANLIAAEIQNSFIKLAKLPLVSAAYFIWKSPYMVAANNTFIHNLLLKGGFQNVFADQLRYPVITSEHLIKAKPEVILLSSEPYPFQEKHVAEFKNICPNAVIKIVDGELFSWYGSRLRYSVAYFQKLREELTAYL